MSNKNNGYVSRKNTNYSKGGEKFIANSSRSVVPTGATYPTDAVQAIPLEVKVYNNFDKAFKAFRAQVQKERILALYKEKQSFEKRSDKLRRKRNEMRRKLFELEMKKVRYANGDVKESKKDRKYDIEPMAHMDDLEG
jgi:ribosomal protein S21